MPKIPPYNGFELGPIRPPSEAYSLLLRINRGWGRQRHRVCLEGVLRTYPSIPRRRSTRGSLAKVWRDTPVITRGTSTSTAT